MYLKIYNLIINCFTKKYFQFKGRATRTEYNSFWLFCFFISCLIDIVLFLLNAEVSYQSIIKPSTIIFECITVLPFLSVTARRLHDFNWSFGFHILLLLSVIILSLLLLILSVFCEVLYTISIGVYIVCLSLVCFMPVFRKGNKEANRYGEPPEY